MPKKKMEGIETKRGQEQPVFDWALLIQVLGCSSDSSEKPDEVESSRWATEDARAKPMGRTV
jgi:hypothetical protein